MDPPLSRPPRRFTKTTMHYKRSSHNQFGRKPEPNLGTLAYNKSFPKGKGKGKRQAWQYWPSNPNHRTFTSGNQPNNHQSQLQHPRRLRHQFPPIPTRPCQHQVQPHHTTPNPFLPRAARRGNAGNRDSPDRVLQQARHPTPQEFLGCCVLSYQTDT